MNDDRLGLAQRCVWVMGAGGGGIGTAICAELAAAGAAVVAVDRDRAALDATLERCAPLPGSCQPYTADLIDEDSVAELASRLRDQTPPPFGLVNVVGGLLRDEWNAFEDVPGKVFDEVLARNLRAAWHSTQHFGREHAARSPGLGGSVVHLSSIAALEAMPFGAAYAASKAAILSLTRTLALEWGARQIRVNALAAGSVEVPRSPSVDAERDRRALPLGRRGKPEDIAGGTLFLLSDLASWMTGQVLVLDGGAAVKPATLDDFGLPVFVDDPALRERLKGSVGSGSS